MIKAPSKAQGRPPNRAPQHRTLPPLSILGSPSHRATLKFCSAPQCLLGIPPRGRRVCVEAGIARVTPPRSGHQVGTPVQSGQVVCREVGLYFFLQVRVLGVRVVGELKCVRKIASRQEVLLRCVSSIWLREQGWTESSERIAYLACGRPGFYSFYTELKQPLKH